VGADGAPAGASGHYFDASPAVASRPATAELTLPDLHLVLRTDRGVFGHGGIDSGTKYLLLEAAKPPARTAGDLLDLGCGYGPIALTLARRAPDATVWAVDVNERARELCVANAVRAGITNVRVVAPDEVPASVMLAGLWSNPPIRIGKRALHDILEQWLSRLSPAAHAWLVVQKHLGSDSLARWLVAQGYPTSRLGSRAGYRILRVDPAPPPGS
jgi:16S rRNA (guanine1207-N2)-methyltransferase